MCFFFGKGFLVLIGWKIVSFQLGWYVGKCCVFWVGKLFFFWVIGWKILSFQKRGHETSFQKNGGHFGDFAKFFEKQKWVNILSLVFQVVHVYRKCLFFGGKRVLFLLVLCFLGKVGWFLDVGWTEKNGPTFLIGAERFFFKFRWLEARRNSLRSLFTEPTESILSNWQGACYQTEDSGTVYVYHIQINLILKRNLSASGFNPFCSSGFWSGFGLGGHQLQ